MSWASKDIHGDLASTTELVAIEVKEERAPFLTSAGQAFAYSLYAHKCYLAVRKRRGAKFSAEEQRAAAHFGIGLLAVRSRNIEVVAR